MTRQPAPTTRLAIPFQLPKALDAEVRATAARLVHAGLTRRWGAKRAALEGLLTAGLALDYPPPPVAGPYPVLFAAELPAALVAAVDRYAALHRLRRGDTPNRSGALRALLALGVRAGGPDAAPLTGYVPRRVARTAPERPVAIAGEAYRMRGVTGRAVSFDLRDEDRARIDAYAARVGRSFADALRDLTEMGLARLERPRANPGTGAYLPFALYDRVVAYATRHGLSNKAAIEHVLAVGLGVAGLAPMPPLAAPARKRAPIARRRTR